MGASDDEEEYIVYGRPLQEEKETVKGQYNKEVQDKAVTKALPVWQQEVTDEQGRRRLHGAFTGGYSAGFFNTVGSKEGWAPSSFTSTRGQRSDARQSTAEDFMDEDELAELRKDVVQTGKGFDTFGHAAAEHSRKTAQAEQMQRPGLPSIDLSAIIAPVPDSVGQSSSDTERPRGDMARGVRPLTAGFKGPDEQHVDSSLQGSSIQLLQRMGWRQGRGIGKLHAHQKSQPGSKWGPMLAVSTENVEVHRVAPKDDTHGLGYDPYKGAEDFRAAKRRREEKPGSQRSRQGPGVAFGTGVLDEDDVYGMTDDYVVEPDNKQGYSFDLQSDEEDAGPIRSATTLNSAYLLPGKAEPLQLTSSETASKQKFDLIHGFVRAKVAEQMKRFPPPTLPANYRPMKPPPAPEIEPVGVEPPVPPPQVLNAIQSVAPYVASIGTAFEALALQKNASLSAFKFLRGGEGSDYYSWKIRALRAAKKDKTGLAIGQRTRPLSVGERGLLLGEGATSADPATAAASIQPKIATTTDIADKDRQALQETLRSTFAKGRNQDMGAGKQAEGGLWGLRPGKPQSEAAQKILAAASNKFASAGKLDVADSSAGGLSVKKEKVLEPTPQQAAKSRAPKRTVEEWRPLPLLCRRFNVPDPFRGQAALAADGPKFKTDLLALPETVAAASAAQLPLSFLAPGQSVTTTELSHLPPPPSANPHSLVEAMPPIAGETGAKDGSMEAQNAAQDFLDSLMDTAGPHPGPGAPNALPPPPEKPIDLFKAIFEDSSDDSEDEADRIAGGVENASAALSDPTQQDLQEDALAAQEALPVTESVEPDAAQLPIVFRPQSQRRANAEEGKHGPDAKVAFPMENGSLPKPEGFALSPQEHGMEVRDALDAVRKSKKSDKERKKDRKEKKAKHEKSDKKSKRKRREKS